MSYARFGWDGSDVYVYADVGGAIVCAACALGKAPDEPNAFGLSFPPSWYTPTKGMEFDPHYPDRELPRAAYQEMLAHLTEHIRVGHNVPGDCLERLVEERDSLTEGDTNT